MMPTRSRRHPREKRDGSVELTPLDPAFFEPLADDVEALAVEADFAVGDFAKLHLGTAGRTPLLESGAMGKRRPSSAGCVA